MSNIFDVIQAYKNMAGMLKNLQSTGLGIELSQTGPYTVSALSEIAFGKLQEGQLTDWLKPLNKIKLVSILNNHVVNGKFSFNQLIDGQKLTTINRTMLEIRIVGGNITVNGIKLQGHDNEASDGIVHSLDMVMSLN
jgi:uncharacterized surface protein with fasciclin (FAS1) repeats